MFSFLKKKKIVGSKLRRGLREKKMTPLESRTNGLSKGVLKEKYAFLPGVKNRRKRVKIRPFGNGFHL